MIREISIIYHFVSKMAKLIRLTENFINLYKIYVWSNFGSSLKSYKHIATIWLSNSTVAWVRNESWCLQERPV